MRRLRPWSRWLVAALAAAVVPFIPFALRTYDARRRLDTEVAARLSRGEPLHPADFERAAVPDDRNAAPLIHRAAAMISLSDPEYRHLYNFLAGPARSDPSPLADFLDRHAPAFADVGKARRRPEVVWGVRYQRDPLTTDFPHLSEVKELSDLLLAAAHREHRRGRHDQAIEHVQSILFLARAADAEGPLLAHLVALGIESRAASAVRALARSLDPDAREAAQRLLRDVLDEDTRRRAIDRTARCERMGQFATFRNAADVRLSSRYIFQRAAAGSLAQHDRFHAAALSGDYPTAVSLLPAPPPDPASPVGRLLAIPIPLLRKTLDVQFRAVAERRAAATALALRLYALDNAGKLPQRLTDLVPTYLPALPHDPFAPSPQPFAYRTMPRPALASVSENARFDDWDEAGAQGDSYYNPWASPDAVFHLD